MTRYASHLWSIELPDGWLVEEGEDGPTLISGADRACSLRFHGEARRGDATPRTDADLQRFARKDGFPIDGEPIAVGSSIGWRRRSDDANRITTDWVLRCGHVMLTIGDVRRVGDHATTQRFERIVGDLIASLTPSSAGGRAKRR